jgi:hypothetical protein
MSCDAAHLAASGSSTGVSSDEKFPSTSRGDAIERPVKA